MAALLNARGQARCDCCDYDLSGLEVARGPCPECGRWYWLALAQPARRPFELSRDYLRYWGRRAWDNRPSLRSVATAAFILVISGITIATAIAAWDAALRRIGP
jgi:hypothetical protein